MRLLASVLAIMLLWGPPPGEEPRALPPPKPPCYAQVRYIENKDGDTITCDILLPLDVTLREQRLRLRDLDAWETTRIRQTVTVTDDEIRRGLRAGEDLRVLLATANRVYASDLERESAYGRVLGKLWVDPAGPVTELLDVAAWMKERGHDRRGGQ